MENQERNHPVPEQQAEGAQNKRRHGRRRGGRGRRHGRDRQNEAVQQNEALKATATESEDLTVEEEPGKFELEVTAPEVEDDTPRVEIVGVRFRTNGKVYYFDPCGKSFALGASVIVETSRGIEFGTVSIANRMVSAPKVVLPLKKVLREATQDDFARNERNKRMEQEAAQVCAEKIKKFGLDMKIVDVEYTFDNSKLLFYFTSEGRVDFRELVKSLASVFRTRIELRQIGIRDEAKMLGGIGSCGRPFCCSTFLPDFVQVSIKMAKEQNFSLNSAKISGTCGRLMCCLRYEHDAYEEALKIVPHTGTVVSTPYGEGTVIETRPLTETVKVKFDDKGENPRFFSCKEITVLRSAKKGAPKSGKDASAEQEDASKA